MSDLSPKGLEHLKRHLEVLGCAPGEKVCFRAFLPEKGSDSGRKLDFAYPDIPVKKVNQWQSEGRGVYVVVNPGGHSDEEIQYCRAVFYEHDDLEKELSMRLWTSLGLPEPSIQVDTGGKSIHSYWVFTSLVAASEWRSLQTDLLEFADGDRKLKNPSRVMRLAGCIHPETGKPAQIRGGCGSRYSFDEIRAIVPAHGQQSPSQGDAMTWHKFSESFRFPISELVPLEACLSRTNRELCANGTDLHRSDNGFRLASDLLAISAFLTQEGQPFSGEPYEIFIEYCRRCRQGEGWDQREWDGIWKSAQSKPRDTSLPPDYIENCVKAWAWKNCPNRQVSLTDGIGRSLKTPQVGIPLEEPPGDATDEERLRFAIANYIKICNSGNRFQQIPFKSAIAREFGITKGEVEELARELERPGGNRLTHTSDVLSDTFAEIEERANGGHPPGIRTGFYDLDAMTQGFQPGDLIITAGRPSMGKTGLATNAAQNVAETGLPVVIFSLEMSKEQLAYRLLSTEASIESGRLRSGRINPNEWDSVASGISKLSGLPLWIDDTPSISPSEIQAKCRHLQAEQGKIGLILIDYLQLMGGQGENRVQELSRITRSLKNLALELSVPINALSQLSRGVESRTNKRPLMSDLRESGDIEQAADLILMLYRDEYYDPETPYRGIAEVIIAKHRNGPTGTVKLLFEPQYTRFKNLASPRANIVPLKKDYAT